MGKITRKKAAVIVLALCIVAAVGIGVYLWLNRFDASAYVQAVLDVSYKNETEEYMEITGASEEEADAVFENNLDATMGEFESSAMPEDLQPQYRELFGEIARSVNYTVGEAQKEEDGSFAVPLKVKPVSLFVDTYETFTRRAEEYAQQITDSVMQGGAMPGDEEMQTEVYRIYYEVLKEGMDNGPLYGAAQDITLHVRRNDDGDYEIDGEDMKQLDALLIEDGEEMQ